jgi:hypothetical protein
MVHFRLPLLCATALLLVVPASHGADPPRASGEAALQDALAAAARIDAQLAAKWAKASVEPAPIADDAEFLRRVYLDLGGRIPEVSEARKFLEDKSPDKRQRLVEELLAHPRYVTHLTNVYRTLMLPEVRNNFQFGFGVGGFEAWLRQQFAQNVGYDKMVKELLTVQLGGNGMAPPGAVVLGGGNGTNPLAFYQAKEFKPENLAAAATRLFLGVRLECAQCHDHPFASWKKEQFWSMAAFFAGIQSQRQGDFTNLSGDKRDKHEIGIPGGDRVAQARYLDGKEPTWADKKGARETLADWITSRDNPYFAKATVNRLWALYFGSGLVEPIDEMVGSTETTISHPQLLDELAHDFVAHDFDLKFLIRAIMASKAYQRSSAAPKNVPDEAQLFARMPVRGLTGEQLFDSIVTATRFQEQGGRVQQFSPFQNGSARQEFLNKFNGSERPTEAQTSILHALTLMNGRVVATATNLKESELLAATIDAPFMDTKAKIETLFLATLSRYPKEKELAKFMTYVQTGPDTQAGEKLADVYWALLNSGEFFLNH